MATFLLRRTPESIVFFNNVGFHGHGYIIAPGSPGKPQEAQIRARTHRVVKGFIV